MGGQNNASQPPGLKSTDLPMVRIEDLREPTAPQLSYGPTGSFDAGSLRDDIVWYARGKYWTLYTGAVSGTEPFNPSIGIAWCDPSAHPGNEGCPMAGWVKGGQVIVPNPKVADCAGAVFSPGAFYNKSTDELYVYPSCTAKAIEWYSGPITIAGMKAAAGADWSKPAGYVWQNGGNPFLVTDQPWEKWTGHFQGVYSCDVKYIQGRYVMYYSASGNQKGDKTYQWQVGVAYSSSPFGPWHKTGIPIEGTDSSLEEPAIAQLPNGILVMFTDHEGGGISGTAHSTRVLVTKAPAGLTGWTQVQDLEWHVHLPFNAGHIGSPTVAQMPDGRWLLGANAWDGNPKNAHRTLVFATFRLVSETPAGK